MGLNPSDPLLQLLRRSGAQVAGFGQLDENMQRHGNRKGLRQGCVKTLSLLLYIIYNFIFYVFLIVCYSYEDVYASYLLLSI